MEQVWAATYELGMRKFPGLVLIEGGDLNGGRREKMPKNKERKGRQAHPADDLEAIHF